jgi:hypothetical protein
MRQVERCWGNVQVTSPDDGLLLVEEVEVGEEVFVPCVLCSERLETEGYGLISRQDERSLAFSFWPAFTTYVPTR